jgi:uncharacterized membrane protein YphA (DoxX/SURF4 family)
LRRVCQRADATRFSQRTDTISPGADGTAVAAREGDPVDLGNAEKTNSAMFFADAKIAIVAPAQAVRHNDHRPLRQHLVDPTIEQRSDFDSDPELFADFPREAALRPCPSCSGPASTTQIPADGKEAGMMVEKMDTAPPPAAAAMLGERHWRLAAIALLSVRLIQGFIYWGGGSRRFIYDPEKLNPDAPTWMANKFQSAMPGALFGTDHLIAFLLHHFWLLYPAVILFSGAELIAGAALMAGLLTRLAALVSVTPARKAGFLDLRKRMRERD